MYTSACEYVPYLTRVLIYGSTLFLCTSCLLLKVYFWNSFFPFHFLNELHFIHLFLCLSVSVQGERLQHMMAEQTPHHDYVPWVTVDREHSVGDGFLLLTPFFVVALGFS